MKLLGSLPGSIGAQVRRNKATYLCSLHWDSSKYRFNSVPDRKRQYDRAPFGPVKVSQPEISPTPCTSYSGGDGGGFISSRLVGEDDPSFQPKPGLSLWLLGSTSLLDTDHLEELHPTGPRLSVRDTIGQGTVLITGCTGYVGSLVLEQLLRTCPDVKRVYVVVRDNHDSAEERVGKLLKRPLFDVCSKLLEEGNLRRKITVVHGDLQRRWCGIDGTMREKLLAEVNYVVHCAASINFIDHAQSLLQSNYEATNNLLRLAYKMRKLQGFVHVSTAYVNGNLPKGSWVSETSYPLPLLDRAGGHRAVVRQIMEVTPEDAVHKVTECLQATGFPNAYCLSKRLAEDLLVEAHASRQLPVAIVRPAIIGCVHRMPCPGYVGNTGGATGAALAVALGLAQYCSWMPDHVLDVVPGECVASAVLLAAAKLTEQSAKTEAPNASRSPAVGPLILHVSTSTTNPLTNRMFYRNVVHHFAPKPPRMRLPLSPFPRYEDNVVTHDRVKALRNACGDVRIGAISCLLWLSGKHRAAKKLCNSWKTWKMVNTTQLDFNLRFSCTSTRHLQDDLVPEEQPLFQAVWEPRTPHDWDDYLAVYMQGIRRFCLREEDAGAATNAIVVGAG